MAAPIYSTDLTLIDAAEAVGNYSALGGGASGLSDETDYFIQNTQAVSKAGFTSDTKGMILNTGTRTVAAGDAIFVWGKQNNRNLMDTQANGGMRFLVGDSTSAYDQFYVDGSDSQGSALAGWRNYAVDPTQTPSTTTGSPTTTNRVGFLWKILGSGSLKGNPNAIDVSYHGRELRAALGDLANGYATFEGMANYDADISRRYGILTPSLGGYLFHGALVLGQGGFAVDFRDEARNIVVLDDPFLPSTFNEIEIVNASSNVEWTNIQISHLGTTSPTALTLSVGVFTGVGCRFDGCGITNFGSNDSCTDSTWINSERVNINFDGDLSGSSFITPTTPNGTGNVQLTGTTSSATVISGMDNTTHTKGANAHHAISFGANITHDVTLTGVAFNGFSSTDDANDSTLRFGATSGSINCNLVDCTVDGNPATTANVGVDDATGITVTLVIDPKATKITVINEDGDFVENARVFTETADNGGGSGFPYQAGITSITRSGTTATLTSSAPHGLVTGDQVVVRGMQPDGYNKVATITVTGASTFTYTVDSGLTTPATNPGGYFSYVPVHGLTNASGVIQSSKTWPASQAVSGRVRKSTSSPYYKQANITIPDASGGTETTVTLLSDE